ncbi:MAG: 1-deoxy-D-xylulose-5-phosphate synthase [Burkholderiaceae bacterium]|jgi:1-deoxy-D-xylulose-5-phosphate synthase|nr:1-deoxy-D-xylulose-5-phosphate synthase [Burkholderiaceae bacterium]
MARLLDTIHDPADLRKLSRAQLAPLANALRDFIVESVARTGGHLSSNLGTVELTIALHYVFNTPADKLIWDVGHQTYAHKILTGRREKMKTLRQLGGMSGFPKRDESPYDAFGTAHSSTSISAALGMALAAKIKKENAHAIAVIGDGAMTGGMAFEGLNNAGVYDDIRLLVILNDNDMSISPPVGALNRHLAHLLSGKFYAAARHVGKLLPPPVKEIARRLEEHAKGMIVPAALFEEFGFNYIGPIDGHDFDALVPTLQNLKQLAGPQFLHVVTRKGNGYKLAEADPVLYHGLGKFCPTEGVKPVPSPTPTYAEVFGQWLCDMAVYDSRLLGITPAMREGSGMVPFSSRFSDRFFDVGIAEQHAVTCAAGLACEGFKPVVAIYSTFLQRAYDQLVHDVAIQNLDVTFALDRAGLVGADGETHAGNYDLAYLRCIPNILLMTPSDEEECRRLLSTAFQHRGPAVVRYPRGCGPGAVVTGSLDTVLIGKAKKRREGKEVAILAFGAMLGSALSAADMLDASVVDMRFVKPMDTAMVLDMAREHRLLVTVEEGTVMGGAGSAVAEVLAGSGISKPLLILGLPDQFIPHGETGQLLFLHRLDADGIADRIRQRFSQIVAESGAGSP